MEKLPVVKKSCDYSCDCDSFLGMPLKKKCGCTGPGSERECSYSSELADPGEEIVKCHCCDHCARDCYMNV